ncbi:substrate-binding domain-containing protein [Methanobacterium movens]
MNNRLLAAVLILIVVLLGVGTYVYSGALDGKEVLVVATTTSLEDTGLLEEIEAAFEAKYPNIDMQVISGGTGIAIEYGKNGDADIILVHDKAREEELIEEGIGTKRNPFAYNYFYIVGPSNDPAGIKGMDAAEAFEKIQEEGEKDPEAVEFISRGDDSGTHSREKKIWKATGLDYNNTVQNAPWYVESGKGMGDTLTIADEKQAYTISDSGTFLAFKDKINLEALITESPDLLNVYSAIPMNPDKVSTTNDDAANKLVEFLLSSEGQKIIAEFGVEEYGQNLFTALNGGPEPTALFSSFLVGQSELTA